MKNKIIASVYTMFYLFNMAMSPVYIKWYNDYFGFETLQLGLVFAVLISDILGLIVGVFLWKNEIDKFTL